MEFESIMKKITDMAKHDKKTIVMPESEDLRVLKAISIVCKNDICNIILIGNETRIKSDMNNNSIEFPTKNFKIVDNMKSDKRQEYANSLYELRKEKNMIE